MNTMENNMINNLIKLKYTFNKCKSKIFTKYKLKLFKK